MKRPELLIPVASLLNAGSGHRQIARHLGCSPSTVTRISVRIGCHAELFHRKMFSMIADLREEIVYDHFETFSGNQSNRVSIGTAVGRDSWLVYEIRGVRYRGALRRSQRKRRLKVQPRPTQPGAVIDSIVKSLHLLQGKTSRGLTLITDDSPLYRIALQRMRSKSGSMTQVRHHRFRNPERTPGHDEVAARRRDRAMFAVDLLHKLKRHSLAHHRRETIAFARKVSNLIGRSVLFAVWRNFVKKVSERRSTQETPAMKAGLTSRVWTWSEVFSGRLFEARI